MEESISKRRRNFRRMRSPEEFRSRIRSIGRLPAERTTTAYKIRPLIRRIHKTRPSGGRALPVIRTDSHVTYSEGAY